MRHFYIARADGKAFAGVSSLSGLPRWYEVGDGDLMHLADVDALKHRRDPRWLAIALRCDASARWVDADADTKGKA